MKNTGIAWTQDTWNCLRGCTRISEGCRHCYAEGMAARFSAPGQPYEGLSVLTEAGPRWTGKVRLIREKLAEPARRTTPRMIFVNSMSDVFHESLDDHTIDLVFGAMWAALFVGRSRNALEDGHIFQVLTKRAERMHRYFAGADLPYRWARAAVEVYGGENPDPLYDQTMYNAGLGPHPRIWLGVSVEDQRSADERLPWLVSTPAALRWVSYEPALGPVDFKAWIGYHPLHAANRDGRSSLSSGDGGLDRGTPGRLGVAGGASLQEPMGRNGDGNTDQATSNRPAGRGGVSNSQAHGGREANSDTSSPSRLESTERADPAGSNSEPQERTEGRQHPRQLGISNLRRTDATYAECAPQGQGFGSGWREELDGEAHRVSGKRDSQAPQGRGPAQGDCSGLRDFGPNSLQNRTRGALEDSHLISWLVIGGESGKDARPFDLGWARSAVSQAKAADIPSFVKQLGAKPIGLRSEIVPIRHKSGANPAEWPWDLCIREWPENHIVATGEVGPPLAVAPEGHPLALDLEEDLP